MDNTEMLMEVAKMMQRQTDTIIGYVDSKIDALEAKMDKKIDALEARMNEKIDALEARMDKKIDALEARMDKKIDALEAKLEARMDAFDARMGGFEARMDAFDARMDAFDARMDAQDAKIDAQFDDMARFVAEKLAEQTRHLDLKIENEVAKRIDVLFDGYKANRDKRAELEETVAALSRQYQDVEIRVRYLEGKTA